MSVHSARKIIKFFVSNIVNDQSFDIKCSDVEAFIYSKTQLLAL